VSGAPATMRLVEELDAHALTKVEGVRGTGERHGKSRGRFRSVARTELGTLGQEKRRRCRTRGPGRRTKIRERLESRKRGPVFRWKVIRAGKGVKSIISKSDSMFSMLRYVLFAQLGLVSLLDRDRCVYYECRLTNLMLLDPGLIQAPPETAAGPRSSRGP
jgi:hypothetical protein